MLLITLCVILLGPPQGIGQTGYFECIIRHLIINKSKPTSQSCHNWYQFAVNGCCQTLCTVAILRNTRGVYMNDLFGQQDSEKSRVLLPRPFYVKPSKRASRQYCYEVIFTIVIVSCNHMTLQINGKYCIPFTKNFHIF